MARNIFRNYIDAMNDTDKVKLNKQKLEKDIQDLVNEFNKENEGYILGVFNKPYYFDDQDGKKHYLKSEIEITLTL